MLMIHVSKQNANDYEPLCRVSVLALWTVDESKEEVTSQIAYTGVKILISGASWRDFTSQYISMKNEENQN